MGSNNTKFFIGTDKTHPESLCRIQIGEFRETFEVLLAEWKMADYIKHWYEELDCLLAGTPAVTLTTWAATEEEDLILRGWTFYRKSESADSEVLVQEHLFLPENTEDFKIRPNGSVQRVADLELRTADGDEISTWYTNISAIAGFLATVRESKKTASD